MAGKFYMPSPAAFGAAGAQAGRGAVSGFWSSFNATRDIMQDREHKRVAKEKLANMQQELAQLEAPVHLMAAELQAFQSSGSTAEVQDANALPTDPTEQAIEVTRRIGQLTTRASQVAQQKAERIMHYIATNPDNPYITKAAETYLDQVMQGPTQAAQAFDQFGKATREAASGDRVTQRQEREYELKGELGKEKAGYEMEQVKQEQAGLTERAKMRYGGGGEEGGLTPKDLRSERGKLWKNAEDYAVGLEDDDFEGLRARFPKYADMSDTELREAELQRYYRQRISTENLFIGGEEKAWESEEAVGETPWAAQSAQQAEEAVGGEKGGFLNRVGEAWSKRSSRWGGPPEDQGPDPVVQDNMARLSGHTDEDLLMAYRQGGRQWDTMSPEQREAVAREIERRGLTAMSAGREF